MYTKTVTVPNPPARVQKAAAWLDKIRNQHPDRHKDVISTELHESMAHAIFGSNHLDKAGLDFEMTIELCRDTFAGAYARPMPNSFHKRPIPYRNLSRESGPSHSRMGVMSTIQAHNKATNHVKAFQYILDQFVVKGRDLSAELIEETYCILEDGIAVLGSGMRCDTINRNTGHRPHINTSSSAFKRQVGSKLRVMKTLCVKILDIHRLELRLHLRSMHLHIT